MPSGSKISGEQSPNDTKILIDMFLDVKTYVETESDIEDINRIEEILKNFDLKTEN